MCQCMEDCLISKVGFRLFLTLVMVAITVAVGVNVAFLLKNVHKDNESLQPSIERYKGKLPHRVLVMTDTDEDRRLLDHRIDYLKRHQCPGLSDCTFVHGDVGRQATAVVTVGGKLSPGLNQTSLTWFQLMQNPQDFRQDLFLGKVLWQPKLQWQP